MRDEKMFEVLENHGIGIQVCNR